MMDVMEGLYQVVQERKEKDPIPVIFLNRDWIRS